MTPLCMGWGFKSDAQQYSFASCWEQVRLEQPLQAMCFAVLRSRLDTPAWLALQSWAASCLPQVQWLIGDDAEIAQIATPSRSERVVQRFATGSVSEALALYAANRQTPPETARLLVPRIVSQDRRATLAIASALQPSSLLETGVHS
nr:cobalamin biosynthesis protein [Comamonas testosteroni]